MITPSVQSVIFDPLGPKTKTALKIGLVVATALMIIGALVLLSAHGSQLGCCFASIGAKSGTALLWSGFSLGLLEFAICMSKLPIKIMAPDLSGDPIQPTVRNGRFVNGQYDYNPLWDTVENIELMHYGAFQRYPPKPDELPKLVEKSPLSPVEGEVDIRWMGHDSFLIRTKNTTLLTGPNWSDTIPFVGDTPLYYRSLDPGLEFEELPKIDAVLDSHTHRDHFDVPTLKRLEEKDKPIFLCPKNAGELLEGFTDVRELSWWDQVVINDDVEITYLPANHASQTTATDCNRYLWGGYLISIKLSNGEKYKIYFMGDTACNLNPDIKGFRPRYWANDTKLFSDISKLGQFDLVICGIDPINGQEDKHANLSQLADLMLKLNPKQIIPSHWGTWPFDRWGSDLLGPVRAFKAHFEQFPALHGKLTQMKVGELVSLKESSPSS